MAAGKVLDVKRQEKQQADDYKLPEEKRAKLREKMGTEPEPQKITLKSIFGGWDAWSTSSPTENS